MAGRRKPGRPVKDLDSFSNISAINPPPKPFHRKKVGLDLAPTAEKKNRTFQWAKASIICWNSP
ncbi:MAG TPA: hypothetical protein DEA96_16200 [Leptospiraceae bacterium]|nr:hypothetical protein [Spirochaetaceae bacterium]HBS06512.1 hypothetical protein [Leptospiraceae bacterium]|tara:strand:+ start:222 stop:413 length:192 start_codon:yes stop_codon:yes gene_type:complete